MVTTVNQTHALVDGGVVALVDDDAHIAQALAVWLDMLGQPTVCCGSAEELLSHIQAVNGYWEVCEGPNAGERLMGAVLDLNLPGQHGFALAKHLRTVNQKLPIVMMTAARPEERPRLSVGMTPIVCLTKPFKLEALELALTGSESTAF